MEVQNARGNDNSTGREIVPLDPYDLVIVVNQAPFPEAKDNEPEEEFTENDDKIEDVCNEETLSHLFDVDANGPKDKEGKMEDEVQMFHQHTTPYNLRNRKAGGPFTTSTLPNNFNIPPNLNTSNNPSFPEVPTKYFTKGGQTEVEVDQMEEYMAEVLKKVKVDLSAFELLRVPTIRNSFFQSLSGTTQPKALQDTTIRKVPSSMTKNEPILRQVVDKDKRSKPKTKERRSRKKRLKLPNRHSDKPISSKV